MVVSTFECHPIGPRFDSRLYPRNISGSIGSGIGQQPLHSVMALRNCSATDLIFYAPTRPMCIFSYIACFNFIFDWPIYFYLHLFVYLLTYSTPTYIDIRFIQ